MFTAGNWNIASQSWELKNVAWNYPASHFDLDLYWRHTHLAAQQRVGLLPRRRRRPCPGHCGDPAAARALVATGQESFDLRPSFRPVSKRKSYRAAGRKIGFALASAQTGANEQRTALTR